MHLTDAFFIAQLAMVAANTDIRKRMVSNMSVILLLCLGIVHTVLIGLAGNTWWIYPASIALAVPFVHSWLRDGMGAGDVKLVIAISFLSWAAECDFRFYFYGSCSYWFDGAFMDKTKTLKSTIPFAPVLAFGAGGVWRSAICMPYFKYKGGKNKMKIIITVVLCLFIVVG